MADAKPDSLAGKKHVYMHEKIETLRATLRETLHDLDAMRADMLSLRTEIATVTGSPIPQRAGMTPNANAIAHLGAWVTKSEAERDAAQLTLAPAHEMNAKLRDERDRLRAALEFYAKPERYDRFCDDDTGQTSSPSETEGDRGDVARAALNHDNEGTTP